MLEKKYNHIDVEKEKYSNWLEKGYFKSGDMTKEPYCIVIPPPNVTGKLHLGHAWDTTIQDILIRYKRMDGYDALWIPGMDHAGIATQAKVDKKLKDEGINPREMDREEWLKVAWAWKEEYGNNIHAQWAKLGLSLDYEKERFTLDEGLSHAVRKVFVDLYNDGLIYRGERIINWDPEAMTALSNEEVIYKEVKGAFYNIKYMLDNSDDYLEVSTTRPETLFGDTAVAVNPKDDRYKKYIGKEVILPIVNKKIPVIADEHADMEFGTGVVKITPAHDPNDFEVGLRHNLERVCVMTPNAIMNDKCYEFSGLDRYTAREKVVEKLKELGLLISVKEIVHNVGFSERTDVMVEPYLSKQWFVKMRPLADKVLEVQKTKNKVEFVPKRFEKVLLHWMEITHDWCISRQLWWGHRIPAWYRGEEIYVGLEEPKGEGWVQDNDVLDTWFSSALWPYSTLNWPDDLNTRYFPNNVLVTGYDIIPFWVCRMIFTSYYFTNTKPFNDCLIHGLIRDKYGRKMSKSLGNGVDPMDVIDKYGTDALRFFLTTNTAPGMDLRYDEDKVKATWNFINKLWNASRFVLLNLNEFKKNDYTLDNLTDTDKWILSKLNKTIKEVRNRMEKYEFNLVGNTLYSFIWNDFCDKYIELSKFNQNNTTKSVLLKVLTDILKMMHPFMPYVTEEIYQKLPIKESESIMISSYPVYDKNSIYTKESNNIENILEFISIFRNKKNELNITDGFMVINYIDDLNVKNLVFNVLKLHDKEEKERKDLNCETIEYSGIKLDIMYNNSKNIEEEKNNLLKEKEKINNSIVRREKLLSNENYVNKAPKTVVEQEKENLLKEQEKLQLIINKLNNISKGV